MRVGGHSEYVEMYVCGDVEWKGASERQSPGELRGSCGSSAACRWWLLASSSSLAWTGMRARACEGLRADRPDRRWACYLFSTTPASSCTGCFTAHPDWSTNQPSHTPVLPRTPHSTNQINYSRRLHGLQRTRFCWMHNDHMVTRLTNVVTAGRRRMRIDRATEPAVSTTHLRLMIIWDDTIIIGINHCTARRAHQYP